MITDVPVILIVVIGVFSVNDAQWVSYPPPIPAANSPPVAVTFELLILIVTSSDLVALVWTREPPIAAEALPPWASLIVQPSILITTPVQ